MTTSQQILAARVWAAGGQATQIPIVNALVTGVRPTVPLAAATDAPGFFIQAEQAGPAIYVAVDPATLSPAPSEGDRVSLTPTATGHVGANVNTPLAITAVTAYSRLSTGNAIAGLLQPVSAVDFGVGANIDLYESELTSVTGTMSANPSFAGAGFVLSGLTSAGTTSTSGGLKLRLTPALANANNLTEGCVVQVTAPLWRFGATAQPSPFTSAQLSVLSCPAPRLVTAFPISASQVVLSFDRDLNAASVTTGFYASSILTVFSATLSNPRSVLLSTNGQVALQGYSITVSGIRDTRGTLMASTDATFVGYSGCQPDVVISQVYPGGGQTNSTYNARFIELHNRRSVALSLDGYSLQYAPATATEIWNTAQLSGFIAPGGYVLIQVGATAVGGTPLPGFVDLALPSITPATAAGKFALVQGSTALTGCVAVPAGDLVGYGTANCSQGFPTPSLSLSSSAARAGSGCTDTFVNSADFVVPSTPSPRNSASNAVICSCP